MSRTLLIHVRLHEGRYHGEGDWPPCPARLFQALVAAAGLNGTLASARDSLDWLQMQPAPIVGAPHARRVPDREGVMFYMPNNNLDAVQGDPRRIAEVRSATKVFQPYLFDANVPFLYAWSGIAEEDKHHADAIRPLADQIYQLGRGIDMAWAWGEVLNSSEFEMRLAEYPGKISRPSGGGNGGTTLLCPQPGSLDSLDRRHQAYSKRFSFDDRSVTFRKPPRPSFKRVSYDSPPEHLLYELRNPEDAAEFAVWPLARVSELVVTLRDGAVQRLEKAVPDRQGEIGRILIGRKADGTNDGPTRERVRIIPLPSIGHRHADRAIRRILIEVPAGCPLRTEDLSWAFSGLAIPNSPPSKSVPFILTPASDEGMLRHYGINDNLGARTFYSVTPAALPETTARRRIEPTRKLEEAKKGTERLKEQQRAAGAVLQALRHADVRTAVEEILVQREPFDGNGEHVETFAAGTRFSKHQLWHIKITFSEPISGPLVIGDGRFLGLGVLTPVSAAQTLATKR
jgi:CRISPR-associated protein Csb2